MHFRLSVLSYIMDDDARPLFFSLINGCRPFWGWKDKLSTSHFLAISPQRDEANAVDRFSI